MSVSSEKIQDGFLERERQIGLLQGLVLNKVLKQQPEVNVVDLLAESNLNDPSSLSRRLRVYIETHPELFAGWTMREISGHGVQQAPSDGQIQQVIDVVFPIEYEEQLKQAA